MLQICCLFVIVNLFLIFISSLEFHTMIWLYSSLLQLLPDALHSLPTKLCVHFNYFLAPIKFNLCLSCILGYLTFHWSMFGRGYISYICCFLTLCHPAWPEAHCIVQADPELEDNCSLCSHSATKGHTLKRNRHSLFSSHELLVAPPLGWTGLISPLQAGNFFWLELAEVVCTLSQSLWVCMCKSSDASGTHLCLFDSYGPLFCSDLWVLQREVSI